MLSRLWSLARGLIIVVLWSIFSVSIASVNKSKSFLYELKLPKSSTSSSLDITVQVKSSVLIPNSFWLGQNYPNPFNTTTAIKYSCGKEGYITLNVYNILGQHVTTLISGHENAGVHVIFWDTKDNQGNPLASGVYFYRMVAGSFVETKKMLILR